MDRKKVYALFLLLMAGFLRSSPAQIATGGAYTLEQSVLANGGLESTGGSFAIVGTAGQPAVGTASSGGQFSIHGGFWQGFLVPTAASVSISGRVVNAAGYPVSHAIVVFTSATGSSRAAVTNPFGNYAVDGIEVGQAYIVSVSAKSYQFAPRAIMIQDSLAHFDLVMIN